MLFYSATTKGFYDSEIHDHLPEDAVELTKDEYHALFVAQSQGKLIVSDEQGRPEAIDVTISDEEKQRRQAQVIRDKRNGLLRASDVYMLPDYPISDELRAEWVVYRQLLRDIASEADFPWNGDLTKVPWPEQPTK